MKYDIKGMSICFLHEKHADSPISAPKWVWQIDCPNGWTRRTTCNKGSQVIYVRWIKPEEE